MNVRDASMGITKQRDDDINSTAIAGHDSEGLQKDFNTTDSWEKNEHFSGLQACICRAAVCPYLS
jgi:hypothetical protein